MTHLLSDEVIAGSVARIRAERVAAGRPPYIDDPAVYRLLDAVLAATTERAGGDRGTAGGA